jgi:hypothetical protein
MKKIRPEDLVWETVGDALRLKGIANRAPKSSHPATLPESGSMVARVKTSRDPNPHRGFSSPLRNPSDVR